MADCSPRPGPIRDIVGATGRREIVIGYPDSDRTAPI